MQSPEQKAPPQIEQELPPPERAVTFYAAIARGFGTATIAFSVDASDVSVAYGGYGEDQDPSTFVPTKIVFGCVFR